MSEYTRNTLVILITIIIIISSGCSRFFVVTNRDYSGSGHNLAVVRHFIQRFGHRSDARFLKLFAPGAKIEVVGLGVVTQGQNGLRDLFGYAVVVNSRLEMFDGQVNGDTVFCRVEESNDWLRIIGIEPAVYQSRFVLEEGKIVELVINPDAQTRTVLIGQGLSFWRWLRNDDPGAITSFSPDGKFRFTPENGKRLVQLISRWRGGY